LSALLIAFVLKRSGGLLMNQVNKKASSSQRQVEESKDNVLSPANVDESQSEAAQIQMSLR